VPNYFVTKLAVRRPKKGAMPRRRREGHHRKPELLPEGPYFGASFGVFNGQTLAHDMPQF
jgi:hypothetical protein